MCVCMWVWGWGGCRCGCGVDVGVDVCSGRARGFSKGSETPPLFTPDFIASLYTTCADAMVSWNYNVPFTAIQGLSCFRVQLALNVFSWL